jgi:hypothetical protein
MLVAWRGGRQLLFAGENSSGAIAPEKEISWDSMLEFEGNLFVSLLLATADMKTTDGENIDDSVFGDPNGLAGVVLTAPHAKTKVKVSARGGPFWEGGVTECVLPLAGEKYWIAPRLRYHYDKLKTVTAPQPWEVTLALELDGAPLGEKAVTGTVRPLKECVFGASISAGFSDKVVGNVLSQFGWLFAAYVDEEHPFAAELVKEALATGLVRAFDGYQSGDPEQVLVQVFALWEALTRRGARYHHYMRVTADSNYVYSEPVRTMDEIAERPSGTSAEAVALLASALLRIGLRPFFIIVTERIQLGVDRSDGRKDLVGIDPTYMGVMEPPDSRWPAQMRDSLPGPFKDSPSLAAYGAALADGTDDVVTWQKRFDDGEPRLQMFDVRQARVDGIVPFRKVKVQGAGGREGGAGHQSV